MKYRQAYSPTQMVRGFATALILPVIVAASAVASPMRFYGQVEQDYGQGVSPTAVRVCGAESFNIQADAGGFTKVERALIVERNINNALISTTDRSPNAVEVVPVNNIPVIRLGGKHIVTIDHLSAQIAGTSMQALADQWANSMRQQLADRAKVDAYVAALGGDFISPQLATAPYRRARLEAARLNHASNLFRSDVPLDLVSSNSQESAGMTSLMKRNPAEAAEHFKKAIALEPRNARAHYGLGVSLLKQGQVDDATRSLEFSRWLDHDSAETHLALGQAAETKGLDTQALSRYREAALLQPDNPEPILYIADLREERNDIGKSVRELTDALFLIPDSQYIRLRRNDQLTWRLKRPY